MLEENGIEPVLTSIRQPQTNLAEIVNKGLGKYLMIYCHNQHHRSAEYLPFFKKAMNNNYKETTSFTSTELESRSKPYQFWR